MFAYNFWSVVGGNKRSRLTVGFVVQHSQTSGDFQLNTSIIALLIRICKVDIYLSIGIGFPNLGNLHRTTDTSAGWWGQTSTFSCTLFTQFNNTLIVKNNRIREFVAKSLNTRSRSFLIVNNIRLNDRINCTSINVQQIKSGTSSIVDGARMDQKVMRRIVTIKHMEDLLANLPESKTLL